MQKIDSKYTDYARKVIDNEIVAGELIKLACKRYMSFFERDDVYFDTKAVDKVVNFIGKLRHSTDAHYGKPFILSDWQYWMICNIYGFKWKKDGTRITRTVYIEIGRKNGKSSLMAALALYHLVADDVQNAQVIFAANSAKQAGLCFEMSYNYCSTIDRKGKYFKRFRDTIKFPTTKSKLEVVSADAKRLDGLNASFFICDELHEAPNGKVWNVLESSQGMRQQPLAIAITTAGFNRSSFCYSMRSNCIEILMNKKQDDSTFIAIYTIDKDDDPFSEDETIMKKANPNLHITVQKDYLINQIRKAKNNPTLQTNVLTKLFNCWVSSSEEWISSDYIIKSSATFDYKTLIDDYVAYLGVDLGATSDLTAVSVMIPTSDKIYFRNYYFIPSTQLQDNSNRELYNLWVKQGHLIVTNGNVTDYDYILNTILKLNDEITINSIAYDQWNATQWAISATEAGLNLQPYSMSIGSLNRPTKELARLIMMGKVVIYNNPIDRFCFQNVVIKRDYNDNERPTKETRENKIDGVLAMVMALGNYLTTEHFDTDILSLQY